MSDKMDKYIVSLATHKGNVREENEDNFIINTYIRNNNSAPQALSGSAKEPSLAGVFDGMGGEKGGAAASAIAAKCAVSFYNYLTESGAGIDKVINSYVFNCNKLIKEFAQKNKLKRCGSTFAMAYFNNDFVYAVSLGDSRIYLYRDGQLRQVSVDHTLANKKFEANIYTREEAEASQDSHILTSYLGINNDEGKVFAQVYKPFILGDNDKLLICSDGLYDMCGDSEIRALLSSDDCKADSLISAALNRGGQDNITCVIISKKLNL